MILRRIFSALVLATTVAAAPACFVTGTAGMRGTVAYSQPPPPQQESVEVRAGQVWIPGRWDNQNGQWVWVDGRWEQDRQGYRYQEGQWVQRGSSWHWVEGSWISAGSINDGGYRGDGYDNRGPAVGNDASDSNGGVMVGGGRPQPQPPVVVDPRYPTAPPPALRVENYDRRSGFLWVSGRWDWRGGRWEWIDGHWERERANQTWSPGRWELQGNYYIWIEGSWR
jgi:hypothetical protein